MKFAKVLILTGIMASVGSAFGAVNAGCSKNSGGNFNQRSDVASKTTVDSVLAKRGQVSPASGATATR